MLPRRILVSFVLVAACSPSAPPPATTAPPPAPAPSADADAELEARVHSVVAAKRPNFRVCYEQGLARDPALAGSVVLMVEVDQSGRAARVLEGRRKGSFTDEDVKCFAHVLRETHFHDGAGHPVRIQVPLAFEPAQ